MPGPQPYESSSWGSSNSPSTQLRLRPRTPDNADIEPMDLSKIDDDPNSYFLTPGPLLSLDDNDHYNPEEIDPMDFEMDFDAGIEDFKHPAPIIRSVSPSSLEGLSLPPGHGHTRPPTPPKSPGTPDSYADMPLTPDDYEDYMRFASASASMKGGRSLTFPIRLADLTLGGSSRKFKSNSNHHSTGPFLSPEVSAIGSPVRVPSPLSGYSTTSSPSLSYSPPLVPLAGGVGVVGSSISRGRTRTLPPRHRRRSPHAWRQPSPDVWSIEEETQDAIETEIGGRGRDGGAPVSSTTEIVEPGQEVFGEGRVITRARARAIDISSAAKPTTTTASSSSTTATPRKRVRFVLPVLD